jgi:hypothetical protein
MDDGKRLIFKASFGFAFSKLTMLFGLLALSFSK